MADENDEASGEQRDGEPSTSGLVAPSSTLLSTSFDPSTWVKTASAADQPSLPSMEPATKPSRRLALLGLGASVAVTGAVAVGAFVLKRPGPSAPGPTRTSPIATAGPGVERLRLVLTSLGATSDALSGQGLSPQVSKAAAAAAIAAMPQADGDLRLELALARSPGAPVMLVSLQIRRPDGSGVLVTPRGADFVATPVGSAARKQVRVAHGQMDSESFYSSAVSAGLSDAVIPDFFQAFVYDFDFQREIEPGDVFEAALEETLNDQGEALGARRLLYASMSTKTKSRALYAFAPSGGAAPNWFDGAGRSIQRSLMRTPVEGARISSTFGMRLHPVLGFTRMHKGTDFATPVGTPVFASGDGKVVVAGFHTDFGNYIRIQHTPTLATAYAHLSKIDDGIAVGVAVRQGQQIALTGNTGLTSGPHLHYEVLVNGEQVDSQTYQTEQGVALSGDALSAFIRERDRIDGLRATAL